MRRTSAGVRAEMRENVEIDKMISKLQKMKKHNMTEIRHLKRRK